MSRTPTPAEALALYETACRTHRRAAWRVAAHQLANVVLAAQAQAQAATPGARVPTSAQVDTRVSRGLSLCEFLAQHGINDDGGELAARDAGQWHRQKAFRRKLIRPDGLGLEDAAERAFDRGYFPDVPQPRFDSGDNQHPVDGDMLLAAIDRELRGRPIYADGAEPEDDRWAHMEPEELT